MVAVAYRRWSFTRGSNGTCKALTGKVLVFWIGGRSWQMVEVGLYKQNKYEMICHITALSFSMTRKL